MIGWLLLLVVLSILVVWRRPIWGYVQGKPYLSNELRRFINKQTALRQTVFITDDAKKDKNWVCDLCGVTALSPADFLQLDYAPDAVVSIANERQMASRDQREFYSKLARVPVVVRVRNRWTAVLDETKEFDALSERRVMSGNVVFTQS
jgi:F420-0:gamma-glutamyl ligase-like protein